MAELAAFGPNADQHWQNEIPPEEIIRIGRAPATGWGVPWDNYISREHVDIYFHNNQLLVKKLPSAQNPLIYQGSEVEEFSIAEGDQFQIGETIFQLIKEPEAPPEPEVQERVFDHNELKSIKFGNADHRLELLATLPEMISNTRNDADFAAALVDMLLAGIKESDAAAVVEYESIEATRPKTMRWSSRTDVGRFTPSRRLIVSALENKESVMHIWAGGEGSQNFTMVGNLDWAFCTPINSEATQGWCLYVSGKFGMSGFSPINSEDELKGHLRFAELLAQFISAIREVRLLEQQQAGLSKFFSPAVMETLTSRGAEDMLEPRESDISALFCDVRGFSKKAEQGEQNLLSLLNRVSKALSVMTRGIMTYGGAVSDFQGDAALGFWGWPNPPEDGPLPACRAALYMHKEFIRVNKDPDHLLAGFQVGIGVGFGNAVAGQIGSEEQVKVGIFGPVVNMASRLEGMTKQFYSPILVDEATADFVRQHMPPTEGRVRRVAHVQPKGMEKTLIISQLLPPEGDEEVLSDQNLTDYESALDQFMAGDWAAASATLEKVPAEDSVKQYLVDFISEHQQPPEDWDGVIRLTKK